MACDLIWEQIFATRGWGKYPPEHIVRAVMRSFGTHSDRSSVRILDLGCGPGANTWFLAREGFSVVGIDGSASAISQNRARLSQEGLDADLYVGDITGALPMADSTFDMVIDNAAFYANPMANILSGVAEVMRVLKPGGLFLHVSFTDRCYGYGEGRCAEGPGAYHEVFVGPLANRGFVQFLDRVELDRMLACFVAHEVNRGGYTLEGGPRHVEQWVVECRKPEST